MSHRRQRLSSQAGFIREIVWIAVILGVIALIVLDGMAIFSAYQSAEDASATAAEEARTEYAQSLDAGAAKAAAEQYVTKSGLTLVDYKAEQVESVLRFTVTAEASADTYGFHYLSAIPPLKDWVERTLHPVRSGSAE